MLSASSASVSAPLSEESSDQINPGADSVSGGMVGIHDDDMTGLLATQTNLSGLVLFRHQGLQFSHHIFIPNGGLDEMDVPFSEVVDQCAVAHGGADNCIGQQSALGLEVIRQDSQHMVAIHQVAVFIDEDHPVGIAIEDHAKIGIKFS